MPIIGLFCTIFNTVWVLETEPIGVTMSYKNSRAGDLKIGSYALIDNEPCQIVDIEKSKPGKHGSAKIRASGISLFDGKKKTYLAQADAGCQVPIVDKRSGQIVSITPSDIQLMDLETYETIEMSMPTDDDIASKIAAGKEVEYWVIMGRYKINRVKS
jgi:translation initiation factor 5A